MWHNLPCPPVHFAVDWSYACVALVSSALASAFTALVLLRPTRVQWATRSCVWSRNEQIDQLSKRELHLKLSSVHEPPSETDCKSPNPFDPRPRSEYAALAPFPFLANPRKETNLLRLIQVS